MVGHEGGLPQLHLGIDGVNLRQLFVEDGAAEGRGHQVGEGVGAALCPYVALYSSEERLAALDAEGHHIEPRARVVGPGGAPVLVVLDVSGREAQAQHIFLRMMHNLFAVFGCKGTNLYRPTVGGSLVEGEAVTRVPSPSRSSRGHSGLSQTYTPDGS